jgi:hypothetical protein
MSDVPNGRYQAQAVNVILGETRTGKEQMEIVWEICDGEHAGAQVTSLHYFTGGAKPITVELMKHLGWKEGGDLDLMRGKASITVYEETFNGMPQQKVRAFVPSADGIKTPENKRKSPAASKAFLSRLTGNGGGDAFDDDPGTPPPMPGDDAKPGSDDLPF